ncbi:MAG TPA: hypothetical protein VMZ25_09690 [Terriglobales bacterium]|nr:hypothetical protein [Terriglobales bacterium]
MTRTIKVGLLLWALVALAVGSSGVMAGYPVRVAQTIGAALLFAQVIFFFLSKTFRTTVLRWSLRSLTLFQSWRIIPGTLFLYYYYALGQLPFSFAVIGGYGDILIGLTAILICPLGTADGPRLLKILLVWQIFGLLDLLFVIRAGFMASLADPAIMRPLTHLPLILLPLFLVPITLFAHFISIAGLIQRLRR